jgi:hypothetical protein
MISHSSTYVRDNLEKLLRAGLPFRITWHGISVGYYNPIKRKLDQEWEDIPREVPAVKAAQPSYDEPTIEVDF